MLFFLCMDYVGGVNMSLRIANTYRHQVRIKFIDIELR